MLFLAPRVLKNLKYFFPFLSCFGLLRDLFFGQILSFLTIPSEPFQSKICETPTQSCWEIAIKFHLFWFVHLYNILRGLPPKELVCLWYAICIHIQMMRVGFLLLLKVLMAIMFSMDSKDGKYQKYVWYAIQKKNTSLYVNDLFGMPTRWWQMMYFFLILMQMSSWYFRKHLRFLHRHELLSERLVRRRVS